MSFIRHVEFQNIIKDRIKSDPVKLNNIPSFRDLSLASCSPAELVSVSISYCNVNRFQDYDRFVNK